MYILNIYNKYCMANPPTPAPPPKKKQKAKTLQKQENPTNK
jgi:hypothetical protein